MGMGEQVNATLDDDLYDKVCNEHTETGRSKSEIVNDRVRSGYNGKEPSLTDTIMPVFGQSLFVVGFVVAFLATSSMMAGVGTSLLGLAMMLGAKVDEYRAKHGVGGVEALIRVLGA